MARKKQRARKRNPRLTYADKLARLRTVYTPSFRARKRFTPQQKSAITRKWKREARRASYRYVVVGRRSVTPPITKRIRRREMEKALPIKPRPRKPPRIVPHKVKDSDAILYDVSKQTFDKMFKQIKRMQARNEGGRFIVDVPKTPDYPNGKMYTSFYNFRAYDDDELMGILEGYGNIHSISGVQIPKWKGPFA